MIVNRIKFSFLTALLPLAAAFLLGACSKWNEPEALQLKLSGAKDRDPQLWGRYMDVLRSYKSGSHYLTYAEFDNGAESPVNEGSSCARFPTLSTSWPFPALMPSPPSTARTSLS